MISRRKPLLFLLLAICLLLWGFSPRASAQNVYAAIHGTVTDASGAVIPHANVTVLNTGTGISTKTTTDDKGYFIFPQLQVGGPYTVTVSAAQFQKFSSTGLTLNVNDNREVDASLSVGAAAQTINVAASAVQVDTSDTQLKQIVTSDQLEQIPLEGRDPAGLGKLNPGVVESSDRFGSYSTNGSQTPQNSYLLSGIDINDGPLQDEGIRVNPDALAQENIVTSTLNPEFSRNSGQVVNEVIKSGSNSYHGSGFEYYRDTFLNNGNYFSLPGQRPQFHQNLYGGTLGGPVKKDKLFFFLGYQGFRNRTGATTNAQTMSDAQFAGNFTGDTLLSPGAAGGLSDNPIPFAIGACAAGTTWADCFPGNNVNIPTTQWNSIASKVVTQFVPHANNSIGGVPYYNFNAGSTRAQDQGVIRIDYTPTSRDTFWASSVFESHPGTDVLAFGGGDFPGFGSVQSEHFKLFSTSWTHTFNNSMLNELRGGYYRFNFPTVEPSQIVQPSSYGFNITPNISQAGLPYMSIGANFNLGFSFEGPQPRTDTNLTIADNFSWVLGSHSLKFGASFEQFRVDNPFAYLNNGYYYYDGGSIYSSGDPLIDFVMGVPDGYEQTSDGFINAVATERYAYAQDNWKVSPTLTVNYGVAWDAEQPNQNRQFGGLGIICYVGGSATSNVFPGGPPGLQYPGDPGCNAAGGPTTHYDHFGPRVGFAWSPSSGPEKLIGANGSHDFSVRGAFGVYFNRDQEEQSLQNLTDPPFLYTSQGAADVGGSPAFADPFSDVTGDPSVSEANRFPYTPPKAGGTVDWTIYNYLGMSAFDRKYNTPYVYNFNLNIQRSLPSNMVAQIGYVGSLGRRLATWYEGDPITPAGHDACASGSVSVFGIPCNDTRVSSKIHEYFPQLTANPAVVPGTVGTVLPNGLPWYSGIGMQNSEGSSNYNSLQASLTKAITHGFQFTLAYTYSHALDNASGYESATGSAPGGGSTGRSMIYTPGYTYLNYGDSDYDARHRLVASYIYVVPVGALGHRNAFFREALSGWEIAGVTAMQTGFPVGIATGQDRSLWCDGGSFFGCGDNPDTSNFHPKSLDPRAAGNAWFDSGDFSLEPLGTFGNTKRNYFHGPGFNYTNLQVSKNFPVSADGSRYVQLRLEGFNAFNHANFSGPDGTFTSPGFGQITSVIQSSDSNADPQPGRAVQLAGKFYF
ncbi:MAG TPA: carboxypeptidase-like regulatory domain-containing protein [Acidobacteriaceae bacterium]|nr:carboxypeptidase-like regulatory domain-containing protein [Acidobacteriaceae bacterium]